MLYLKVTKPFKVMATILHLFIPHYCHCIKRKYGVFKKSPQINLVIVTDDTKGTIKSFETLFSSHLVHSGIWLL